MLRLALIGEPAFNLGAFLRIANDIWGHSLVEKMQTGQRQPSNLEQFLVSLSSFLAGDPTPQINPLTFEFVTLNWVLAGDQEEINESLNWSPTMSRFVVPSPHREIVVCMLQATLTECASIVAHARSLEGASEFKNQLLDRLEQHGLMKIIRQAKAS